MDVKVLTFKGKRGETVRRFQYTDTAIDDATRVRALKVYEKHTQANASVGDRRMTAIRRLGQYLRLRGDIWGTYIRN